MSLMQPLGVGEALDPLTIADPTRADLPYRKPVALCDPGVTPPPEPVSMTGSAREAGVEALLGAFAAGALSPIAVIDELVDAIGATRAGREAVLRLAPGLAAMAEDSAERWKSCNARPLEGVPFGVKDIIDVEGAVVTSGSLFTGERRAEQDASVVARLRAAGAIPFAITATTEFASGSPHNPRYGAVSNPWDERCWTGGSSTGSGAALAARLMPMALGTDTGGSIRVPSCWCGATGIKPSRELVSRRGVAPLSWTLDHVGPMARNGRDLAHVLPYMADIEDAELMKACQALLADHDIAGLRIGVPVNWFIDNVDAAVLANWAQALKILESLGCTLVDLPVMNIARHHQAGWVVLQSELAVLHGNRLDRADLFDAGMLHRLKIGLGFTAVDYGRALQGRLEAQAMFFSAMDNIDVIVTPGIGGEAGWLDTLTVDVNGKPFTFQEVISRNTMIFDYTGFPALMAPSGLGRTGLPTGMQFVGRPGSDALCLRAAVAFQAATAFHAAVPAGARL